MTERSPAPQGRATHEPGLASRPGNSVSVPNAGPANIRLDDEGEALAHAIFHAMKADPEKKWKHVSRHAKARYREAARAVRRVLAARKEAELSALEGAGMLWRNPAPNAAPPTVVPYRTYRANICAAQGMSAGTAKTPQAVEAEGRQPGSRSECAQPSSGDTSNE